MALVDSMRVMLVSHSAHAGNYNDSHVYAIAQVKLATV